MNDYKKEFLEFAISKNALKLGKFTTKFGRKSPYFFNAGLFNDGESLTLLAKFYANTIINNKIDFDIIFGPAYKGIVLASVAALGLAQQGINKPFAYNRKEIKDHGEGGHLIGAKLKGKVLIVDDVISAGTSIRESIQIIKKEKAMPAGVVIALDRMEKGFTDISATQEIQQTFNIPVYYIANLNDLLTLIENNQNLQKYQKEIQLYKDKYVI